MSLGIIFGIICVLLLLPDAYIVFGVMKNISWLWRGLFLLPTLLYLIVAGRLFLSDDTRQLNFNLLFWLTLCVVFPVLLFVIVSLIGKAAGLFYNPSSLIFNRIGVIISAIWFCVALYGIIWGWRNVTVEKLEISSPKINKSFDGYKIVQISDMHIGTYDLSPSTVDKIVDKINCLNPDLIVFTGDLVNMEPEEIDPFEDTLKRLKAKDGVVSILGNHDYCLYKSYKGTDDNPAEALQRLISKEKEMGWKLLLNESVEIERGGETISILGVENSGGKNFIDRSDLQKALKGVPEDSYKILLSHDPSHWRREVLPKSDIDLTLSGHTHAMQFKIGNFSPSKWAYKEWEGLYEEGDRMLHVNTGTGENIAFRFGAYPQITLITLKSKDK